MVRSRFVLVLLACSACSLRPLEYLTNGDAASSLDGGREACAPPRSGVLNDATAISIYEQHACALRRGGTIVCWGDNAQSQSGIDLAVTLVVATPTTVELPGVHSRVAVGRYHSCSIGENATVWCWGIGLAGEVGGAQSDNNPHHIPVRTLWADGGIITSTEIAGGSYLACGIATDGTPWCTGVNDYGALGVGPQTNVPGPQTVGGLSNLKRISAGSGFACVASDTELSCWGKNDRGELGVTSHPNLRVCGAATSCAWEPVRPSFTVPIAHPLRSLGGGESPCVVDANGVVQCWGAETSGRTGDTSFSAIGVGPSQPHRVAQMPPSTIVAGGAVSTCAVSDGGVFCVGEQADGGVSVDPSPISGVSDAISVGVGLDFACALSRCGEVQCWGANMNGQLGSGGITPQSGVVNVVAPVE